MMSQNPNGYTNYPPQGAAWNPSHNMPQNAAGWLGGTITRDIAPFRVNDKYPNGMKPGQIIKHKETYYLIDSIEKLVETHIDNHSTNQLNKFVERVRSSDLSRIGAFLYRDGLKVKLTLITKEHASEIKLWVKRMGKNNASGRYNQHISTLNNILSSFEEPVPVVDPIPNTKEQKESEEWLNTFVNELKARLMEAE